MKTLYLVFSRLRQYFHTNKLIFIIFFIGSISCSLAFIYFYGNSLSIKVSHLKNDYRYRTYYITLDKSEVYNYCDLQLNSLKLNILDIDLFHKLKDNEIRSLNLNILDSDYFITASIKDKMELYAEKGRVQFTEQDKKSDAPPIIAPYGLPNEILRLNKITIDDINYVIIGVNTWPDRFVVPIENFNFSIDQIKLILNDPLSQEEDKQLAKQLQSIFPNSMIEGPSEYYKLDQNALPIQIVLISCIYIISLISFMFLLKFLINLNSLENIIYTMVGASKNNVVRIILLEITILTGISNIISIFIHRLFGSFFDKINMYQGIEYSILDYIFIFLVLIFLSILAALPFINGYIKNSIIISKTKYS